MIRYRKKVIFVYVGINYYICIKYTHTWVTTKN
jgi:hypothetical protein